MTLATIETSTAGSTAITENRLTIWTCSRAAARPRRLACTTCHSSRKMISTSSSTVAALIIRKVTTTCRVGAIGVSPVKTTKVRNADSSARPTAKGAIHLRSGAFRDSVCGGSIDEADGSALVMPEKGQLRNAIGCHGGSRTDAFLQHCCPIATNPWRATTLGEPWADFPPDFVRKDGVRQPPER